MKGTPLLIFNTPGYLITVLLPKLHVYSVLPEKPCVFWLSCWLFESRTVLNWKSILNRTGAPRTEMNRSQRFTPVHSTVVIIHLISESGGNLLLLTHAVCLHLLHYLHTDLPQQVRSWIIEFFAHTVPDEPLGNIWSGFTVMVFLKTVVLHVVTEQG